MEKQSARLNIVVIGQVESPAAPSHIIIVSFQMIQIIKLLLPM